MSETVVEDPMQEAPAAAVGPEPAQVEAAFRNIVTILQAKPENYRLFGVWWWPVKSLLRRAGYTTDQAYMLGSYNDPETSALVPRAGLQETLGAAFTEYAFNAAYPRSDGMVEDPNGEIVRIWDADAGV